MDIRLNRWYDHGIGVGGKLFDPALRLLQNHGIREVVTLLKEHFFLHKQKSIPSTLKNSFLNRQESLFAENSEEAAVKVHFTQPLGNNPAITDYLQSRGISLDIAVPYCKEVYFTIRDKNYFALGFQNRSGGYELRNAFLKISSTPKDIYSSSAY